MLEYMERTRAQAKEQGVKRWSVTAFTCRSKSSNAARRAGAETRGDQCSHVANGCRYHHQARAMIAVDARYRPSVTACVDDYAGTRCKSVFEVHKRRLRCGSKT
ncbi:hypothetical protein KCP71_05465 [Salmonella enterica subsp. enterica]|nr:hypothetical protein KCP71_05465 [Salmonella enterica subsp. enterica]